MKNILLFILAGILFTFAQAQPVSAEKISDETVAEAVRRGVDFLRVHQEENGSFDQVMGTGITSLAVSGMLANGYSPDDPTVAAALKYLETMVQPDGSIHNTTVGVSNYETSLAVLAFHAANADGRYDTLIKNAEKYIRANQWDEAKGKTPADEQYGSAGYGTAQLTRGDMSNTGFLVEALHTLGAGADDEAIKKALIFASRCQRLETAHNTLPFAAENPDGGFIYTNKDYEQLDENGEVVPLRSYGSMTYMGLKTMLYAGLSPQSTRVKAALEWLGKNYSVKENPGMEYTGLFYYYVIMSRALKALGEDTFTDDAGIEHDWRQELIAELIDIQQEDGSWLNTKRPRWMENNPKLVTAYALIALGNCRK